MNALVPANSHVPRPRRLGVWLPRSTGRRLLFLVIYVGFLVGLGWLALKSFWSVRSGVPLNEAPLIWDQYYPELRRKGVMTARLEPSDGSFDVLLLGASVLEPGWGAIEQHLRNQLEARCGNRYRLFNLAASGHTSRDSLQKYSHLEQQRFDLVIVYHAINDVRMNNCAPGTFQLDYSHCAWYRSFQKRLATGRLSLDPGDQLLAVTDLIDLGAPEENLREFGRDIKTPPAFRRNLEEMLAVAKQRGDRLVLMTFASHLPADYSLEAFKQQRLDYQYRSDRRSCLAEMWGEPDNVRRTLAAHNEVLRELAREHPDAPFVDQEAGIPPKGKNFVDLCHLTDEGSRLWVENLLPELDEAVRTWNATEDSARAN